MRQMFKRCWHWDFIPHVQSMRSIWAINCRCVELHFMSMKWWKSTSLRLPFVQFSFFPIRFENRKKQNIKKFPTQSLISEFYTENVIIFFFCERLLGKKKNKKTIIWILSHIKNIIFWLLKRCWGRTPFIYFRHELMFIIVLCYSLTLQLSNIFSYFSFSSSFLSLCVANNFE